MHYKSNGKKERSENKENRIDIVVGKAGDNQQTRNGASGA